MGLSINKLIVATNRNDILKRAINTGKYKIEDVAETISPSMDIQVASNFERLLYHILDESDSKVGSLMSDLSSKNLFCLCLALETILFACSLFDKPDCLVFIILVLLLNISF